MKGAAEIQADIVRDFEIVLSRYAGEKFGVASDAAEIGDDVHEPHCADQSEQYQSDYKQRALVICVINLNAGGDIAGIFKIGQGAELGKHRKKASREEENIGYRPDIFIIDID